MNFGSNKFDEFWEQQMTNVWRMDKKKIFVPDDNSQRFGLLLPKRRNERRRTNVWRMDKKKNLFQMTIRNVSDCCYQMTNVWRMDKKKICLVPKSI